MVIGPDGTKWVGSYRNGIIGFNDNGNLIRQIVGEDVANLPINHIKSLALDNNNILWIGTYKGLRILYNTSNFFTEDVITTSPIIFIEDGLPKELLELQFITAIIVDGSNNKWISTVDSGVFYLSSDGQNTIYHFTKDNSPLPSNGITSMAQNQNDGTIYFGTNQMMRKHGEAATKNICTYSYYARSISCRRIFKLFSSSALLVCFLYSSFSVKLNLLIGLFLNTKFGSMVFINSSSNLPF